MKFVGLSRVGLCGVVLVWSGVCCREVLVCASGVSKAPVDPSVGEMDINLKKFNAISNSGLEEYHKILQELSGHEDLMKEVLGGLFKGGALEEMSILLYLKEKLGSKIKAKDESLYSRIEKELNEGVNWEKYQIFAHDRPSSISEFVDILSLNAAVYNIDMNEIASEFIKLSTPAKAMVYDRYSDFECVTPFDRVHNFNIAVESAKTYAHEIQDEDAIKELDNFCDSNIASALRCGMETSDYSLGKRSKNYKNYVSIAALSFPDTEFTEKIGYLSSELTTFMENEMDPYDLAGPTEMLKDMINTLEKAIKEKELKEEAHNTMQYLKDMAKAANLELESSETIRENKLQRLLIGNKNAHDLAETHLMLHGEQSALDLMRAAGKSHKKAKTDSELKKILKQAKNTKPDTPIETGKPHPFNAASLFEELDNTPDIKWIQDLQKLAATSTAIHGPLMDLKYLPADFLKSVKMPDFLKLPTPDAIVKVCETLITQAEAIQDDDSDAKRIVGRTFRTGNYEFGSQPLLQEHIMDTENASDALKFSRYVHMGTLELPFGKDARAVLLNLPQEAQSAIVKAMDQTPFTPSQCQKKLRDSLRTVTGTLAENGDTVSKSTVRMLGTANGLMQNAHNSKLPLIILPILILLGGASFYGMLTHKQKSHIKKRQR